MQSVGDLNSDQLRGRVLTLEAQVNQLIAANESLEEENRRLDYENKMLRAGKGSVSENEF
jgi:regulator of replication initiation timing